MKKHWIARGAAVAGIAFAVGGSATAVGADPSGAKNAFTFPATCTTGTTTTHAIFVVNNANGQGSGTENNPKGQGNFAPAHVVGSNDLFHPTAFNITFTFTPATGPSQSFQDTAVRPNGPTPTTCAIHFSSPDGKGNTFTINGTVKGYFS